MSNRATTAILEPLLQHLDAELDGRNDSDPQDGLPALEQQVTGEAVVDGFP